MKKACIFYKCHLSYNKLQLKKVFSLIVFLFVNFNFKR